MISFQDYFLGNKFVCSPAAHLLWCECPRLCWWRCWERPPRSGGCYGCQSGQQRSWLNINNVGHFFCRDLLKEYFTFQVPRPRLGSLGCQSLHAWVWKELHVLEGKKSDLGNLSEIMFRVAGFLGVKLAQSCLLSHRKTFWMRDKST